MMTDDELLAVWDRICKASDPIEERDRLIAKLIDEVELLRRIIGDMTEESDARRLAIRYRQALERIRGLVMLGSGYEAMYDTMTRAKRIINEALKEGPE